MYQLILCLRYLRTRYIALASIVSVTLGVATMIVVNSVMSGFTTEMQQRIHSILSDITVESRSLSGFSDYEAHKARILRVAGDSIEGMTPTVFVPAILGMEVGGTIYTQPVQLVGIDVDSIGEVGDFCSYLQHPTNQQGDHLSFDLREGGYDTVDHQSPDSPPRRQMADAGKEHRRRMLRQRAFDERIRSGANALEQPRGMLRQPDPVGSSAAGDIRFGPPQDAAGPMPTAPSTAPSHADPFAAYGTNRGDPFYRRATADTSSPRPEQKTGAIIGIALSLYRFRLGEDKRGKPEYEERFLAVPGDDVTLTFPTAGMPPEAALWEFTVVDLYESKMSQYDSSFVFAPLEAVQDLRGMRDPSTGVRMVNSIQIKLVDGADAVAVRDKLRAVFPQDRYIVNTWRDKQGALLAAVQMETAILNVLLFMIIAVAGFGILAIFFMIVVEKTRDIGLLKSLGASAWGVMRIFLAYGFSLGILGAGVGTVLGLLFVAYINGIADWLAWATGKPVFDPEIYYFSKIPTAVSWFTVSWIVFGAVAIAVAAAVLPALRAARLHPVEALRYE